MPQPRTVVLRAPGTNCDVETAFAFERSGAQVECLHLFRVLENPRQLEDFQILCIPGGFSYGDDVGAGAIFGSQLRGHLGEALHQFLGQDKLVLGICNGFQVLMRSGILPGGGEAWPPKSGDAPVATLTWNNNAKYTARWVHLSTAGSKSVFLRGIEEIDLPIAHAEGKIAVRDTQTLGAWRENRQIALCYSRPETNGHAQPAPTGVTNPDEQLPFPYNPNGSTANIAGLCDPTGRVLGLMPHPERYIDRTQHPTWTRRTADSDEGAGLQIFRNAVEYFSKS